MSARGLWVALLLAGSSAGIARIQPHISDQVHDVQTGDDVYLLPPPNELRAMTLGYRAAAVDAIWAKLLVEYGTHWHEKRAFREAPRYFDGILALEPSFDLVFKYAETLIVYRPPRGDEQDWYTAKKYLERGLQELPSDHEVWLHYGQFLAFSAASFLSNKDEIERYRREGAQAIVRAVELGADVDRSISAATLLSHFGERDAAIRQLRGAYALTDDPMEREQIAQKLARLEANAERDAIERDMHVIEARWRAEYLFLSRDAYMLLGPIRDPLACAGRNAASQESAACAEDWNDALRLETDAKTK